MMIRWHKQRKSCDGQTDGWTEPFIELLGRSLKRQGQSEGFDSCDRPSNINQVGFKSTIFWPRMIFKFDGWPQKIIGHLFYATSSLACASFHSHQWIQTGVTVQKRPIRVKIGDFFVPCDLEIWWMTLKNNRAPILCHIKLCASFHRHMCIQTGVMVRKWLNWVLTSVTLTIDLWPWPFAWTSPLSMVLTPDNFMMIQWWKHSEKGVTDGPTDRRTDRLTD